MRLDQDKKDELIKKIICEKYNFERLNQGRRITITLGLKEAAILLDDLEYYYKLCLSGELIEIMGMKLTLSSRVSQIAIGYEF